MQADPTRLAQVLSNLLNNAAKYTPDGGRIALAVEPERRRGGRPRARQRRRHPPRDAAAGLRPVHPGGPSLDRSQGGLGIGLTLVRAAGRAARRHGRGAQRRARARAASSSSGCPRRRSREATVAADADGRAAAPPARCRVLVVDDNVDAAESLAMLLRLGGHEVRLAHDGPAALEAARRSGPRWSCWTSACRGWTATRWRARPACRPADGRRCWSR